jgi:hypothetical protein
MAPRKKVSNITFGLSETEQQSADLAKSEADRRSGSEGPTLVKSIVNILNGSPDSIERLAFESNPTLNNRYSGIYRTKTRLVPDDVCKRIAIQDSLVSNIVRARQNHVSMFGRPRPNRFSTGYVIEPEVGILDDLDEAGKKELNEQIERAVRLLNFCGHTEGLPEPDRVTFAEYLSLSARSGVVVGRLATEIIYVQDPAGNKKFHHFAATDAGTIYKATTDTQSQESVRQEAFNLLVEVTGKKNLKRERFEKNEYAWIQVIEGTPRQVFTSDEMKVYNFYAVPDVELDGYPVTPIDTVITAITTHINIVTHNKLYFQSGRAAKGMVVIKSDDATPTMIHNVKQQFNNSINSVNNSHRLPVFGCGVDESVTWQPIDGGGSKDMEFQYLTDMNAREILTAFMMSPDELPGWSYLSRGTNSQSLSESNNEYKLTAARDVGLKPLILGFEDFINTHLLPLIDPDLAKKAKVRLAGLDADNAEKEAVRIQQDMNIWETYDGILERVEKKPIGIEFGGSIPLNQAIKSYWDQYFTVGEILEKWCGRQGASKDPQLAYRRDPFWFQWVQLQQQAQQLQQQAQMQQQQAAQGGQPGGGQGQSDQPKEQTENQKSAAVDEASAKGSTQGQGASEATDLARSIDVAMEYLTKSEGQLPPEKRRILARQRKTVDHFMRGFVEDSKETIDEILSIARHHAPKK